MVQTFTCNVCGIVFNDEEKLRDHSQLHSSGSVHVSKALLYHTVSVLHHLSLSEPFPTETKAGIGTYFGQRNRIGLKE